MAESDAATRKRRPEREREPDDGGTESAADDAAAPMGVDQRCEAGEVPQQGRCVARAPMCSGRAAGSKVCDGDSVRFCADDGTSSSLACGQQQRCATIDGQAACVCVPGSVDLGNGCQVATNCDVDRGGCDPVTTCSRQGDERVCSACPAGYRGEGKQGCVPLLSGLMVSAGGLNPAFMPDVRDYRLRLPLLQQQLAISMTAPDGVRLEIDEVEVSAGVAWISPLLPLGETVFRVRLTSRFSVTNEYTLTVERAGAQTGYLKASRTDRQDFFGSAIALWGDTLVVGTMYDDSAAVGVDGDPSNNQRADSGAAYVFVRDGDRWKQQAYLKSDATADNEFFGVSVALWGDTLAVGASSASPWSNTSPTGGIVHIFTREAGRWQRKAGLTAPDGGDSDLFGYSLALERDRLIVGAPYEGAESRRSGAIYVFERQGGVWGDPVKLKADMPAAEENFGWSIALAGDTLLVGAIHADQLSDSNAGPGAAYVLAHSASGWTQQERLLAPEPSDSDTFGWSVALHGEFLAVGAPCATLVRGGPPGAVHLFERGADRWQHAMRLEAAVPRTTDYFGSAVVLDERGLLIGASGDASESRGFEGDPKRSEAPGAGALYMYGRQQGAWSPTAFIKASNSRRGVRFGERISIYGDTVAVAATGEASSSMGVDGDPSGDGPTEAGAVYVLH